ncbi:MAG: transketolase, partial [Patescibacteria group bacterium]|nr:transketolase [Patescibacteria group bacterium]
TGKPFVIVAETQKGHGISFLSDQSNWHGKPLPKDLLDKALEELGELEDKPVFKLKEPYVISGSNDQSSENLAEYQMKVIDNSASGSDYKIGEKIATREVYGQVLVDLARKNDSIFCLDAEVKNSTFSQDFLKVNPERFIECFIAEQNMVSVAAGLSRFGKTPFVSTFAAFFTRAADQIRMAWLSKANIKFVGSHAGVSIGEDGASQMGLEEFSLFGTLPGVFVLQPSDGVSASKLLIVLANNHGMGYLQTLRPKTPVLYSSTESFEIGGSKILKQSEGDVITVAATGITVHEALKAYDLLKQENVPVRIIDCYSISPVDRKTLSESINASKIKKLITVEDHFLHGGLGDFAAAAPAEEGLQVYKMAVTDHSHSGTGAELLHKAGIDADCIVAKV